MINHCEIIQNVIDSIGDDASGYIAIDNGTYGRSSSIIVKRGPDRSRTVIGQITLPSSMDPCDDQTSVSKQSITWIINGFFITIIDSCASIESAEGLVIINLAEYDSIDKLKDCIKHNIKEIKIFAHEKN